MTTLCFVFGRTQGCALSFFVRFSEKPGRALQKIGVNINQIARRINSTGTVYAQDLEDIKGALAQIWQLQRSILSSQR